MRSKNSRRSPIIALGSAPNSSAGATCRASTRPAIVSNDGAVSPRSSRPIARDAAAGDAASQWLLGSLYLFGLGVPQDRHTGMTLMQTATHTAIPAIRAAIPQDPLSEMELFSAMLNLAEEALPPMVQQHGAAWGVASYKQSVRTILQALSGCQ